MSSATTPTPTRPGRRRDHSRDAGILDAALALLSESGRDGMTVDLVAARAGAARATVYRRWASKADLAHDAVARLGATDVGLDQLPDTGSLRADLIDMIEPHTVEQQQFRIRVITGLLSLSKSDGDDRLADATNAGIAPRVETIRLVIQRAVDRGDVVAPTDLATLAEVVPMMCICRAVQQRPITREFSLALIDGVLLPALRGAERPEPRR